MLTLLRSLRHPGAAEVLHRSGDGGDDIQIGAAGSAARLRPACSLAARWARWTTARWARWTTARWARCILQPGFKLRTTPALQFIIYQNFNVIILRLSLSPIICNGVATGHIVVSTHRKSIHVLASKYKIVSFGLLRA